RVETITGDEVNRVAEAWDHVLSDPATEQHVLERAFTLGAPTSTDVLERLRDAVEAELADVVRRSGLGLVDLELVGAMLPRVARALQSDLLSELELRGDALRRRVDERRELSPVEEWRQWSDLRVLHERAVELGGAELRRLAFPNLHSDVLHLAVWLFNQRKERPIANAMFRWGLNEANAVGDAHAVEVETKNIACGV